MAVTACLHTINFCFKFEVSTYMSVGLTFFWGVSEIVILIFLCKINYIADLTNSKLNV